MFFKNNLNNSEVSTVRSENLVLNLLFSLESVVWILQEVFSVLIQPYIVALLLLPN